MIHFKLFGLFFLCITIYLGAAVYEKPTAQFKPVVEVSALYIEDGDRILLLHRQGNKSHGNSWAIPGGKIQRGETPMQAVLRETFEETGFTFLESTVLPVETVFVEHNEKDHFVYHTFRTKMIFNPQDVKVDFKEHKGFTWVTPQEALEMNLMQDEDTCFKRTFK